MRPDNGSSTDSELPPGFALAETVIGPTRTGRSRSAPRFPFPTEDFITATALVRYADQEIRLGAYLARISDPRKAPQIALPVLLAYFLYGSVVGLESFNNLDQMARTEGFRSLLRDLRPMLASDSTFARVLRRLQVDQVGHLQRQIARCARAKGYGSLRLPSGRRVRLGIVDGTVACGQYYSVLDLAGRVDALADVEPYSKGEELAASERLLRRGRQFFGERFVHYVAGDGLYMTQEMIRLVRDEIKAHLLVKTREANTLNVIQGANVFFDRASRSLPELQYVQGEDPQRKVSYEIWAAAFFYHQGVGPLKVARVRERSLRNRNAPPIEFWVITTDVELSPEDMRFLAHERWSIENDGFKALNALASSKHQWVQRLRPRPSWSAEELERRGQERNVYHQVVVRLLMVAHMLMQMFMQSLDVQEIRRTFGAVRITVAFVSQLLFATAVGFGPEGAVPVGI